MLRSKMATLLTIVSAMLISAGMTWQQRLLFIGGIAFGVVVEALPSLVDELKERVAEWRRFRQFSEGGVTVQQPGDGSPSLAPRT